MFLVPSLRPTVISSQAWRVHPTVKNVVRIVCGVITVLGNDVIKCITNFQLGDRCKDNVKLFKKSVLHAFFFTSNTCYFYQYRDLPQLMKGARMNDLYKWFISYSWFTCTCKFFIVRWYIQKPFLQLPSCLFHSLFTSKTITIHGTGFSACFQPKPKQ